MSEPPPPRYRVVERDRRLVVIDTWDKEAGGAGTPVARPTQPGPTRASATRTSPARAGPMRAGPMGTVTPATGFGGALVRIACAGASDGEGRPILSTFAYYDAKGPREIILSAPAARRLAAMLSRVVVALLVIAVILFVFPALLFVAIAGVWIGVGALNSQAKPLVTRWLDGLEAQSTA